MFQSVSYITIDANNDGQRVDNFLMSKLKGVPKTYVYRIIRKGEVRVNKKRVQANSRLTDGDVVRVPPIRLADPKKISSKDVKRHEHLLDSILYQDQHILVLNKPSGLAVHSGSGLQYGIIELLRELTELKYLELVHRLDRETSGCLLFAKKRSALTKLSEAFRTNSGKNHQLDKRYLALVKGNWQAQQLSVKAKLSKKSIGSGEHRMVVTDDGQYAHTIFTTRQAFDQGAIPATLVEAKLLTGRTHQVRVHALHSGHPLASDDKYGEKSFNSHMKSLGLRRMFLHASKLSFVHPHNDERMTVEAPLSAELAEIIEHLKNG